MVHHKVPFFIFIASTLGRPWTIYEGFQFIILSQAEALVELGADISLPVSTTDLILWKIAN